VVRVELGPAAPIDAAIEQWRGSLTGVNQPDTADQIAPHTRLRTLVWEPLEQVLPAQTRVVFLCPDGKLTALPWAALPGRSPDSYLLQEYALAVVPHGPFLLERLTAEETAGDTDPGVFLVVGDVSYDGRPMPPTRESALVALRSAVRGDDHDRWGPLPATGQELAELVSATTDQTVLKISGTEAGTDRILAELPQVRWAHFATHGFFADASFRSVFQLDPESFAQRSFMTGGERTRVSGRNPLVLSGLVLAGANRPRPLNAFGIPQGDGGILTAEAIAGLPLGNLDLATLSACETGLGDVAGGEGVFGLQRAFHIAGAHTVVASLWNVDDQATQELMTHFYRNMWEKDMGKLQALRQAQLAMLNRSSESSRSGDRGPGAIVPQPSDTTRARARPELWAAWVLSGDPGDLSFVTEPSESVTSMVPVPVRPATANPATTISTLAYIVAASVSLVLLVGPAWYVRRRNIESKS
jgi:CHAT domain-containing protein